MIVPHGARLPPNLNLQSHCVCALLRRRCAAPTVPHLCVITSHVAFCEHAQNPVLLHSVADHVICLQIAGFWPIFNDPDVCDLVLCEEATCPSGTQCALPAAPSLPISHTNIEQKWCLRCGRLSPTACIEVRHLLLLAPFLRCAVSPPSAPSRNVIVQSGKRRCCATIKLFFMANCAPALAAPQPRTSGE